MLEATPVSRSLDRRSLIFGLEITDIFAIVLLASCLNVLFGSTEFKIYLVYLPTLVLGSILVLTKRGKPDGFLLHFLRFHVQPKHLCCFQDGPSEFQLSKALVQKRKGDR